MTLIAGEYKLLLAVSIVLLLVGAGAVLSFAPPSRSGLTIVSAEAERAERGLIVELVLHAGGEPVTVKNVTVTSGSYNATWEPTTPICVEPHSTYKLGFYLQDENAPPAGARIAVTVNYAAGCTADPRELENTEKTLTAVTVKG